MNPFGFGTQGAAVGAGGYNSNPNIVLQLILILTPLKSTNN